VSESENASAGWPAGQSLACSLVRSFACLFTRTRPAETCSGSELFYFLGDYFYLVRIARTQAGEQADRRAGRLGAALRYAASYLRRFCRKRAHPENYQRPAGRPRSRHKNSILLEYRRRTLFSLPRLPLSQFPVSLRSSSSIVHSSFPRFLSLSISLNPLLAVFVSLTSRVSSLVIFVTHSLVMLSFSFPPSPSRFLAPSLSYQSTVCAAQTMHFFVRLSRGPLSWEVEI